MSNTASQEFLPTQQLEELLHEFAGCGYPHPPYMTCQWCDILMPEAITAINQLAIEAMLALIGDDIPSTPDEFDVSAYYKAAKNELRAELRQQLESTKEA